MHVCVSVDRGLPHGVRFLRRQPQQLVGSHHIEQKHADSVVSGVRCLVIELAFLFGFFRVVFGLRFFWLARRRSQIAQRPSTYATDSEDEGWGDEDNVTGARNNPSFVCRRLMMIETNDLPRLFAKTGSGHSPWKIAMHLH